LDLTLKDWWLNII